MRTGGIYEFKLPVDCLGNCIMLGIFSTACFLIKALVSEKTHPNILLYRPSYTAISTLLLLNYIDRFDSMLVASMYLTRNSPAVHTNCQSIEARESLSNNFTLATTSTPQRRSAAFASTRRATIPRLITPRSLLNCREKCRIRWGQESWMK